MPELLEHVSVFLDLPKGFALDKQSFDDATDTPEEKQKKVDEADEKTTAAAELSKTLAESKVRGLERVKGMFESAGAHAYPLRATIQRQKSFQSQSSQVNAHPHNTYIIQSSYC